MTDLIFIEFTVFVLFLSLFLKCDDHKTYKDVHHEESNDDDVDNEEDGNLHAVVVNGSQVLPVGVDCLVEQTEKRGQQRDQNSQPKLLF